MIRKDEDRFVLKPQREGGGNNFYGANIVKELEECSPEKRMEYTLMARINPKAETGYLLKRGVLEIQ
jgi:glutathione synthase